jgi:hypothetical protein
MSRFPLVDWLTPWNEGNNDSQPTWGRTGARRAAVFTNRLQRNACVDPPGPAKRKCGVIAGDVKDLSQRSVEDWEKWTKAYVDKLEEDSAEKPKRWGIHSYLDIAEERVAAKSELLAYKALLTDELGFAPTLWETEGGARLDDDQSDNEQHDQAREIVKFNELANDVGVDRWFYYHFCCGFENHDSALVDVTGDPLTYHPREAYYCYRKLANPALDDTCDTSP